MKKKALSKWSGEEIHLYNKRFRYPPLVEKKMEKYKGNPKSHEKYSRFLCDKRVVVVSGALHMEKSEWGSLIDSFDVVVRMNEGWKITKKYSSDFGSRTDILYSSLNLNEKIGLFDINGLKKHGLKWKIQGYQDRWKRTKKWMKMNKNLIPFRVIDWRQHAELASKMGLIVGKQTATCGMTAIYDILKHDISTLYVTGFTFFITKPDSNENFYFKNYRKILGYHPRRGPGGKQATKKHPPKVEFRFFQKLCHKDKRIVCDPFLKNIVENNKV